jgi:hypothetical protein
MVRVITSRRMRWTESDYAEKEDTIQNLMERVNLGIEILMHE